MDLLESLRSEEGRVERMHGSSLQGSSSSRSLHRSKSQRRLCDDRSVSVLSLVFLCFICGYDVRCHFNTWTALCRKMHRFTVQHLNKKKLSAYYHDLYHTLLNVPAYRFLFLFISCYLVMYTVFACFYMMQPKHCVSNVQKFSHALWFSVHTAATIGYGHQSPDPDCLMVNLGILTEVLTSALMQAALFGLVFARFATPSKRGSTIKFSSCMVCHKNADGKHVLAFRLANLRHHQLLRPRVSMLMVRKVLLNEEETETDYVYHHLKVETVSGESTVWVGLPSILIHVIDESSPFQKMSQNLVELEDSEVEFVILLDGIDEMTSTAMQARHSYSPEDIRWNHRFVGILNRGVHGALQVNYAQFDATVPCEPFSHHFSLT